MYFPEIVKLNIEAEIDGFERTIFSRLLPCFDSIEDEAKVKAQSYFQKRCENFHPDYDDEGSIYEDTFFEELYHIQVEEVLKHEFLNSSVVWLSHLYERQAKRTFGTNNKDTQTYGGQKTKGLSEVFGSDYNLNECDDWKTIKEFRLVANAIKHGQKSDSADKVRALYPNLLNDAPNSWDSTVKLNKGDIEKYIESLRCFWKKALKNRVVLPQYENDEDESLSSPSKDLITL